MIASDESQEYLLLSDEPAVIQSENHKHMSVVHNSCEGHNWVQRALKQLGSKTYRGKFV